MTNEQLKEWANAVRNTDPVPMGVYQILDELIARVIELENNTNRVDAVSRIWPYGELE